jgi:hypothetical protein
MKRNTIIVGTHSVMHAVVDFGCAMLVMGIALDAGLSLTMATLVIWVYDFCAFALQYPVGILADPWNRNSLMAAIGCFLVAAGFAFRPHAVIACAIAGIGNALYHVGGGVDVLNISDRKASFPGIYVATGSVGLYLGMNGDHMPFGSSVTVALLIVSGVLLIGLYLLIRYRYRIDNEPCKRIVEPVRMTEPQLWIIYCMMLTVCLRSCFGMLMKFPWRTGFTHGLIAVIAVTLGKMLGGIIGDRLGWMRTSVTSLFTASVLFAFADRSMACGVAAMLLFNMSMPITLSVTVNMFPKRKGAAFGLISAMLFCGLVPAFSDLADTLSQTPILVSAVVVSAVLLLVGLKLYHDQKGDSSCHGSGNAEHISS